jgi:hypothetical protein
LGRRWRKLAQVAMLGGEEVRIATEGKVLKVLEKGGGEVIVVYETQFKGRDYLGVRIFWYDEESDEYRPSKKGLNLNPDTWKEIKEFL